LEERWDRDGAALTGGRRRMVGWHRWEVEEEWQGGAEGRYIEARL
jgi:hypothetical protein